MPPPKLDPEINARWARVRGVLRAEVGEAAYTSWLKPLALVEVVGEKARISVPTRFMRDWVVSHYGDRLLELWTEQNSGVKSVEVYVQVGTPRPAAARAEADAQKNGPAKSSARARAVLLKPGSMIVSQPEIPVPLLVEFPFPSWSTRRSEVAPVAPGSAKDPMLRFDDPDEGYDT